METISAAAAYTLKFINQTQRSIFLTGKAGTGKTTLLKEIIQSTHKNVVVVAPTGIAALNAGGVTIHSMFQLPFGGFIPASNVDAHVTDRVKFETKDTLRRHFRMSGQKKAVIQNMELLIIDEVSMLRADLLDAIDFMMQSVRKKRIPFGGVQVLFIGDLLQLPPVVREEEWQTLRNYYTGKFFFHSHVVQQNPPLYIELSKIFRQTDDQFIAVLNNLRNNEISQEDVAVLNQYVQPNFDIKSNKGYITLTTHNAKADTINADSLDELNGKLISLKAEIVDDFPDKIFPIDEYLHLKVGAQVMFVKNDLSFEKNYFNGKMGFIESVSSNEVRVHFPEENKTIDVEKYEWKNIRYSVNSMTKEIEEEVLGTFVHYPIKLAWAITVHKSQGLTFDKAALDVSQVFMPGQAYVALSRLRSLNGLILLSPLRMNGISSDKDVINYAQNRADENILANSLQLETRKFIHNYLVNTFEWGDLIQEWRNHQYSYNEDAEKSEKSKHHIWAKKQASIMYELETPSQKFISQLNKLFSDQKLDYNYISERINAAFNYFLKPMDDLVYEILWKLEEVKRVKLVKAYYQELLVLEELQIKAVLRLLKAKKMIEIVVTGELICKENLTSPEIKNYKVNKMERLREDFKKANMTLVEEDPIRERYTSKKKEKSATPKKATTEETYELWLQKNSIEQIAELRKLTPQTISGHISKLIEAGKVQLTEVLPEDKIAELAEAFSGYTEASLIPLKDKYGDKFSWDELKMFKATLTKI
ncbi:molybdopterin-guanine dinucleotide biosynthesis protein/DNA-binding transcriptional ArsR family regulator [Flavobacterium arsenatis]|uniref:Molybdopterin-guanine dinucleotide biosynthesis protein/DNA-binding transcriptional ArsR family regulator n=1 Tax=Flavobacterium arsenatis TaxID=1484332 RepID=A0ABU1TUA7_9FLAO|nr:helix-turn-helix domain-containing protein [Flavobacterium arsenatis]MDR6969453.1 molybdopterin-guanine dinucleotide biosynthesis protein/DNA-binding transcriptional ArsR family regulator [Flavobacterium arsenatis]